VVVCLLEDPLTTGELTLVRNGRAAKVLHIRTEPLQRHRWRDAGVEAVERFESETPSPTRTSPARASTTTLVPARPRDARSPSVRTTGQAARLAVSE
jgi:hypothetical protein